MMALEGFIAPVKGRMIAPRVSMLMPGIAPKIMPPNNPATKNMTLTGSPNSNAVPCMKFWMISIRRNLPRCAALAEQDHHPIAEIVKSRPVADRQADIEQSREDDRQQDIGDRRHGNEKFDPPLSGKEEISGEEEGRGEIVARIFQQGRIDQRPEQDQNQYTRVTENGKTPEE